MATYVLVHGAWSGAHTFRKVRPLLREAGHEVFTPSLTGIGERSHLASPEVGLSTHVRDVANAIRYEDLDDIVLLGYSYGGCVVTGALGLIGERVRDLVYLDAFVPADGQSLDDLFGAAREPDRLGAEWLVPPIPRTYDDPVEAAWQAERRVNHPIRCFTEKVSLAKPLEEHPFSLTYVKATGEPRPEAGNAFWRAGDHARESKAWRYHEIDCDHMIPTKKPGELAEILLELA